MHRANSRAGFTLIEVMVALAVGAVVVLAANQLFAAVLDGSVRVARTIRETDRIWSREDLLRQLFAAAEASQDSTPAFAGFADSLRFRTSCPDSRGWLASCEAAFLLQRSADSTTMQLNLPNRSVSWTMPGHARFRFLRDAAAGGVWLSRWGRALTPPLGVQLLFGDSVRFYRIGTGE